MEEQGLDAKKIIDKIKEYIQVRTELTLLLFVDKGSQLFAGMISNGLILLFLVMAGFFGSFALGFYLSELFNNSYGGFLIIAGVYLLAALVLSATKAKYLEKRIGNLIIKKIFSEKSEKQDENKDSK